MGKLLKSPYKYTQIISYLEDSYKLQHSYYNKKVVDITYSTILLHVYIII